MTKNDDKVTPESWGRRAARVLGLILFSLRLLIALTSFMDIGSKNHGWWSLSVAIIDFPVSLPILWLYNYRYDLPLLVLFSLIGVLWHYFWPFFVWFIYTTAINKVKTFFQSRKA